MYDPGQGYPLEIFNSIGDSQYVIELNELLRHTRQGRQPFLFSENGRVMIRTYNSSGIVHDFHWYTNEYINDFFLAARYRCGNMILTIRSN